MTAPSWCSGFSVWPVFPCSWPTPPVCRSLPVFFIGDVLKFGHLFDLFGYGVCAGEVLLTITAVIVITFLGTRFRCLAMYAMPAMVWIFTGGITFCFGAALLVMTAA